MEKETKFGYGFLLAGLSAPILIIVFWGEKFAAAVVASILVVVGATFLISGHLHIDAPKVPARSNMGHSEESMRSGFLFEKLI